MTGATVLYDAPGPRARLRNNFLTALFGLVLASAGAAVIVVLSRNGQLTSAKWSPFLEKFTWTTYLLPGLWGTVVAAIFSIAFASVIGAFLGIGRLSDHRTLRWLCGGIVELFRAIPVLLLMIFAYQFFALYHVFPSTQLALAAVVFALTMYNGAVMAEILRSGIASLPRGQSEAAQALGLRKGQYMRMILLPQAVVAMLPALISQMVIALKDSALGYQIGYIEVVRSGLQSASYHRNYFAALVVIALVMIIINVLLTRLATVVERRVREGRSGRSPLELLVPGRD